MVFATVKVVVTHHKKPLKRRSKKTKALWQQSYKKQDEIRRRHASTQRKFVRTTSAERSSFEFYFELSSSKPNENIWWQSHKLGVLSTAIARLRAWHRSRTSSRTSSFSNPSLSHGERLSWDIFKPRVDSGRKGKRDLQFKSFGSIFQAKNKCGLREISV